MKKIKALLALFLASPIVLLAQDTLSHPLGITVGSIVIPTTVAVILGVAVIHCIQLIWPTKTTNTLLGGLLQMLLDLLNKLPNNVKKA